MSLASVGFHGLFFDSLVVDAVPEADGSAVGVGLDGVRWCNLGCFQVFALVVGVLNLLELVSAWLKLISFVLTISLTRMHLKVLKAIRSLCFQDYVAGSGILEWHHGLWCSNRTRSLRESSTMSCRSSPLTRDSALQGPLGGFWWSIIVQILFIVVIVSFILEFSWFTFWHLGRPGRAQIWGEASTGGIIAVLPEKFGLLQLWCYIRDVLRLRHGNLRVRTWMKHGAGFSFDGLVRTTHINDYFPVITCVRPIRRQRLLLAHQGLSLHCLLNLAQIHIIYLLLAHQGRLRNLTDLLQRHLLLILLMQPLRNGINKFYLLLVILLQRRSHFANWHGWSHFVVGIMISEYL